MANTGMFLLSQGKSIAQPRVPKYDQLARLKARNALKANVQKV
jgi:hypothetical protein